MTATIPTRPFSAGDSPEAAAGEHTASGLIEQLEQRTPGRPMPGAFYTDEQIYQQDLEQIFGKQWFFVATVAEIPEAGDYVTIDLGRRSVIVIRDDDEQVRAFHNVCRHRGARVLTEAKGFVGNLRCSYHSWTYRTDGSLMHAPGLPEGTDMACLGLRAVACREIAGLIYLCLAAEPPADIDTFADRFTPYLAPHHLENTKVAAQVDLIEDGNWKLVMENNRECYHCDGHPELSRTFFPTYGLEPHQIPPSLKQAHERYLKAEVELQQTCAAIGLPDALIEDLVEPKVAHRIERAPLDGVGETYSMTGATLVKRPLSDIGERRLGRLSLHTQPNCWLHVMSDHAVTFAVLPLAPGKTLVRSTWLVNKDAVEGVDYDVDELTLVWNATNQQDSTFVALTHAGVSDPAYIPGPYTAGEYQVDNFLDWYTRRMLEGLGS